MERLIYSSYIKPYSWVAFSLDGICRIGIWAPIRGLGQRSLEIWQSLKKKRSKYSMFFYHYLWEVVYDRMTEVHEGMNTLCLK